MIKETEVKKILSHLKDPDPWFGIKYTMNIYRGCQHGCIYCDSRSFCYGIDNFDDVIVKKNAVELLRKELSSKRVVGTIGTGAMSDPYIPIEKEYKLTRSALKIINEKKYPVHIITKSDLVTRDIDVLKGINDEYAAVSFTLTTTNDLLAKKIEKGAPLPTNRLKAMSELSKKGIYTGVTMMPILPFIEDNTENIKRIINEAKENGAQYIIPTFGVTLRDIQKKYYYDKLQEEFPGLKEKYEKKFGDRYFYSGNDYENLKAFFYDYCNQLRIETKIKAYNPNKGEQLSFLNF